MRWLKNIVLVVLLGAAAQARTWPIAKFETTVQAAEDGSAVVIERYEFPFVPKAGPAPPLVQLFLREQVPDAAFRWRVRVNTPGALGTRHLLFVRVISVLVDDELRPGFRARTSGDFVEVSIPVPPGANHHVEIRYLVNNAVRFLSDHDELYWSAANEYENAIREATLRVGLPAGAEGRFRALGMVVGKGARELPPEVDGAAATLRTEALAGGSALAADVVLAKGFFREPSVLRRTAWFLRANLIVLLPVVVFAFMYWLWRKKARNYLPGLSVTPRYEPPEGLTPAEAGTLVDDHVDPRDVTSTLVDLAVRGYVRIEEATAEGGCATPAGPDYIFRLLKPREAWSALAPHERTMLFHTFYGGQWTMLSSLRLRFYSVVQWMQVEILESLKRKGMYRVPPEAAPAYRMLGFAVIVALVLLAEAAGLVSLYQSLLPAAVAIAVSAAIVYLFSRKMTAKTFKGLRARTEIIGFQEFINSVEGDRLERLPPGSFEKFLPYAMALGVEHRWAQAFHGIATEPPGWYSFAEGGLFDTVLFGDRIEFLNRQATATMLTVPRGTSSSPQRRRGAERLGD